MPEPALSGRDGAGRAGGRAACSLRALHFLAGAARASPASEVTPDCAPRPPWHPRLILSQAEYGTLGLQRGGRRESRLPFQKCAVRVSMLIFSDVSVESLFRNPFTAPGSRQPLPPGQPAQRLPPPRSWPLPPSGTGRWEAGSQGGDLQSQPPPRVRREEGREGERKEGRLGS